MGISIAASIMYGTMLGYREDWDEEDYPPWISYEDDGEEREFSDWIVEALGLAPLPWHTYPEVPRPTAFDLRQDSRGAYDSWKIRQDAEVEAWKSRVGYDAYREEERRLLDTVPVTEEREGYGGEFIILRLKHAWHAHEYKPKELPVGNNGTDPFYVNPEANEEARIFCEKFGLPWDPKWIIAPYYSH